MRSPRRRLVAKAAPPRVAVWLLACLLPGKDRAAVLSDLEEEFRRHVLPQSGVRAARVWYWRQVFASVPGIVRMRAHAGRRATRDALRAFGAACVQDTPHAMRMMAKEPGFTLLAAGSLAVTIAVSTAVLSIAAAVLWRPLPYHRPDRLVHLFEADPRNAREKGALSPLDIRTLRDASRGLENVAAYSGTSRTLTGAGAPERIAAAEVTAPFFDTLGVPALVGRTFTPDDGRGDGFVLVLTHGAWQRRFSASPAVVGTAITLNGRPHTIVGVLPPDFEFPLRGLAEFWVPIVDRDGGSPARHNFDVIARLRDGVTPDRLAADLRAVDDALRRTDARAHKGTRLVAVPLHGEMTASVRPVLMLLLGGVLLVTVAGCANVAGLLVARAMRRAHEVEVRAVLGASAARLVSQLGIEGLLLAIVGSAAGLAGGYWMLQVAVPVLTMTQRTALPHLQETALEWRAAILIGAVCLASGVFFAVAPAMALRLRDGPSLRTAARAIGSPGGTRIRRSFVAVEIALAVILLIGTSLLARSVRLLSTTTPGFDPRGLLTLRISLVGPKYDAAGLTAFERGLRERAGAMPSVRAAAVTTDLPLGGRGRTIVFPSAPGEFIVSSRSVSASYFEAMGISVLAGRGFTDQDDARAEAVAIVNRAFAERFFGASPPLGGALRLDSTGRSATLVGVVGNERFEPLDAADTPAIYFPFAQRPAPAFSVVVRTTGDPSAVSAPLREHVRALDAAVPIFLVRSMDQIISESNAVAYRRIALVLVLVFAAVALVVSVTGVYGVLSQAVSQQTRELSLRVALGATRRELLALTMRQGVQPAVVGALGGAVAAVVATRFVRTLLYQVSPLDAWSFALASVLVLALAVLVALAPALRATRADPAELLRDS